MLLVGWLQQRTGHVTAFPAKAFGGDFDTYRANVEGADNMFLAQLFMLSVLN